MTLINFLLLIAGGAIGTIGRYYVSVLSIKYYTGIFPVGTLIVNATGSFLIGFFYAFLATHNVSNSFRLFLFIGLFGSFTTFSAFSLETLNLFKGGEERLALANILANNLLSLLFAAAGFYLAKLAVEVK